MATKCDLLNRNDLTKTIRVLNDEFAQYSPFSLPPKTVVSHHNQSDRGTVTPILEERDIIEEHTIPQVIPFSAVSGFGIKNIWMHIRAGLLGTQEYENINVDGSERSISNYRTEIVENDDYLGSSNLDMNNEEYPYTEESAELLDEDYDYMEKKYQ